MDFQGQLENTKSQVSVYMFSVSVLGNSRTI